MVDAYRCHVTFWLLIKKVSGTHSHTVLLLLDFVVYSDFVVFIIERSIKFVVLFKGEVRGSMQLQLQLQNLES